MSSSEKKSTISRRDLLKVLGATGVGLIGSMMLPGKWSKPVTRMGVLPAHAQASLPTYNIIRSAEDVEFISQQETDQLTLTVYIDPPDSGVLMSATYEVDVEQPGVAKPGEARVYGPPVALPDESTTAGEAVFEPFLVDFFWVAVRVTYEFANADACDTTCSKVVIIDRVPPN